MAPAASIAVEHFGCAAAFGQRFRFASRECQHQRCERYC